jgi:NADPH-dependent glutamate synthase beta subunit-like oxidoreductase/NADH:ubiquinone oxidoreductase subunit F (NADH-binding)/formate hydrogenlyase subunit 6/NADH:ubiquinone oxidoreductase subunit I
MTDTLKLPAWLEAGGALQGANPLPGLMRARALNPLQRLSVLRDKTPSECGFAGEPLYPAWRRFLRGSGPSFLVVDAATPDPHALSAAAILERAPMLLAEGLLIAAGLRGSEKLRLRLPESFSGREAGLFNALDEIRARGLCGGRRLKVEVERGALPTIYGEGHETDGQALCHTAETWCRVALAFAAEPSEETEDAILLTLRRGLRARGLIQVARRDHLRRLIYDWGGGVEVEGQDAILEFDAGLGGFLPLADADVRCQPEELAALGLTPSPGSLAVLAEGACMVEQTRRALYRYWELAEGEPAAVRALLSRATRLVTEITVGKGQPAHLAELDGLALELATHGLAAAWPLSSSLIHFREQWIAHLEQKTCPENLCFTRKPAPCQSACPAHIDIPSFMAHIGHGDYRTSLAVIAQDNPLPLSCGLVCPAPCESACVRRGHDGAVFIRPMKAVAAEHCLETGAYPLPEKSPATGKKVAIVGSGPAGLSSAWYLARLGHEVHIFEAQEEAGGMLRYGIPAYRLPTNLLDAELAQITALGVQIHTGSKVESLAALQAENDALFLGLGTQASRFIPVEGVYQPFVLGGIDFLRAVRGGEQIHVGPRVVVIGGGNVAIDVALTALRQGAKQVELVCLEKRREMPASHHEIETAVAEGVILHPGWGPVSIEEDGQAIFQHCDRVFDENRRFNPVFDPSRKRVLDADQVMLAVGQGTDLSVLEGAGLETVRGFIVTDPHTQMTCVPGVFAGGDVAYGPRTAVEAIRSGKLAAFGIHAWLTVMALETTPEHESHAGSLTPNPSPARGRGERRGSASPTFTVNGGLPDPALGRPVRRDEVIPLKVVAGERGGLRRSEMAQREVDERVCGYTRIERGLSDAQAHREASRCLRCDLCIGCGLCQLACSEMGVEALRMARTAAGRLAYFDFTRPGERCIGCGACAQVCPTGAIRIEDSEGMRRTVITGTVVKEQALQRCRRCGTPTHTHAHGRFLKARLTPAMAAALDRELCPDCARLRADRPGSYSTPTP